MGDEKGLMAAAATLAAVDTSYAEKETPILFKADHSFQMFIVDGHHENTVLFMGQINNPGISEEWQTPQYVERTVYWKDGRDFKAEEFIAEGVGDLDIDGEDLVPLFGGGLRQSGSPMNALLMTVFVVYTMFFLAE